MSVLPAGVDCVCAYRVCSSNYCRLCLCLLSQFMGVILVPIGLLMLLERVVCWEAALLPVGAGGACPSKGY